MSEERDVWALASKYDELADAVKAHLSDPMLDPWTRQHLREALRAHGLDPKEFDELAR